MPLGGCSGSCREQGELGEVLLSAGHPSRCLENVCSTPSKSMLTHPVDGTKLSGRHAEGTGCHSEGPRGAGEVGPYEPQKVLQGQVQGPAPGSEQPPVSIQAVKGWGAALPRKTWEYWWMKSWP